MKRRELEMPIVERSGLMSHSIGSPACLREEELESPFLAFISLVSPVRYIFGHEAYVANVSRVWPG